MTVILFTAAVLFPSDECLANYSVEWCESGHPEQLAAARPVFADLAVDNVGGYRTGDRVATGHGDTIPVPADTLNAVNRTAATPAEARLMVDLAACESRFLLTADNPTSTARGPWQFLAGTWSKVAAATGFGDIGSWAHNATNTLHLGRNGGWQHWACLGRVR